VIDIDAAGAGSGAGWGAGGGALPACTKSGQSNCCYDEAKTISGTPSCHWKQLTPGEAVTVSATFLHKGEKATLPVALTLSSATPGKFASYEECVNQPVGFVLSGAGLGERQLGSTIRHYDLKTDGTWRGQGGGATVGLVAGRDTSGSSLDGGPLSPKYTLQDGLCAPLKAADTAAVIEFLDQIDFNIAGVDYTLDFGLNKDGQATGYYVVVQKGF
jgi:hypothetical protein